jgi:SAM-dependent methyltransferase
MPVSPRYDPTPATSDLPDDAELRLCGDVSGNRRALELGIGPHRNALAFAAQGAKALALDPEAARIAELRGLAQRDELSVECHRGDLADLGFATSGSIDVVVAAHTVDDIDDIGRLLRQVHRVLKPQGRLVIAATHPAAALGQPAAAPPAYGGTTESPPPARYGDASRTIGAWFTALTRSNFRVDVIHELASRNGANVPDVLVIRARKEGS